MKSGVMKEKLLEMLKRFGDFCEENEDFPEREQMISLTDEEYDLLFAIQGVIYREFDGILGDDELIAPEMLRFLNIVYDLLEEMEWEHAEYLARMNQDIED